MNRQLSFTPVMMMLALGIVLAWALGANVAAQPTDQTAPSEAAQDAGTEVDGPLGSEDNNDENGDNGDNDENGDNGDNGGDESLPLKFVAIVALATAIERFWESIFGFFEKFGLAGSKLIAGSAEIVAWARKEQERTVKALQALTNRLSETTDPPAAADVRALQEAEKQLLEAQARIDERLKSPEYLAFKQAVTTLGSLALGVGVNLFSGLELLKAAGLGDGGVADCILTGLAIGAGPGPLHSLIRSLEELRGSLGSVGALARGTGVQRTADALRSSTVASANTRTEALAQAGGAPQAVANEAAASAVQVDELRLQRQTRRLLRS